MHTLRLINGGEDISSVIRNTFERTLFGSKSPTCSNVILSESYARMRKGRFRNDKSKIEVDRSDEDSDKDR